MNPTNNGWESLQANLICSMYIKCMEKKNQNSLTNSIYPSKITTKI